MSQEKKPHVVVPSIPGLSESFTKACGKNRVQVYFNGGQTMKGLLVAIEDKDHITKKCGVVYRFRCGRLDCYNEYFGESSRTLGKGFKEHVKVPCPIYGHGNITSHPTTIDKFSIIGREDQNLARTIKEPIYIRVNNPSLNTTIGKYHLHHIWMRFCLTPQN